MICATEKYVSSCYGDSGGALFTQVNGQNTLLGLVSWGVQCAPNEGGADESYPGVYARVSPALGWFQNNAPTACYGQA